MDTPTAVVSGKTALSSKSIIIDMRSTRTEAKANAVTSRTASQSCAAESAMKQQVSALLVDGKQGTARHDQIAEAEASSDAMNTNDVSTMSAHRLRVIAAQRQMPNAKRHRTIRPSTVWSMTLLNTKTTMWACLAAIHQREKGIQHEY